MNPIKFTSTHLSQDLSPINLPANSCDSHHHIFDRRFPYAKDDKRDLPNATFQDYQVFKHSLGITRHIMVQPSSYGTDNRCLLNALKLGGEQCRGEAVIDELITQQELTALADGGVVGIRFNFCAGKRPDITQLLTLAERVHEFNWHIQLHTKPDLLPELFPYLSKMQNRIVFDHYCSFAQPTGNQHPAWKYLADLMDTGRCWLKLSGLYHTSKQPDYSDLEQITKELIHINSDRLVWGSDWPHPSLTSSGEMMPDDRFMLTKIYQWLGSDKNRQKAFVDNPTELFFK